MDIDPAEIGKNVETHIVGDVKQVLGEIAKSIKQNGYTDWSKYAAGLKEETSFENIQNFISRVIKQLSNKTKGKAIITTEVGCHQMWTAQYYEFIKPAPLFPQVDLVQWIRTSGSHRCSSCKRRHNGYKYLR